MTEQELFNAGLLNLSLDLHMQHNGASDPMEPVIVEQVKRYLQQRLDKWKPSIRLQEAVFDDAVRALVTAALNEVENEGEIMTNMPSEQAVAAAREWDILHIDDFFDSSSEDDEWLSTRLAAYAEHCSSPLHVEVARLREALANAAGALELQAQEVSLLAKRFVDTTTKLADAIDLARSRAKAARKALE